MNLEAIGALWRDGRMLEKSSSSRIHELIFFTITLGYLKISCGPLSLRPRDRNQNNDTIPIKTSHRLMII